MSRPPDQDLKCPNCDYALTGLRQNRCPECGERFDPRELAERARSGHDFNERLGVLLLGAASVGFIAWMNTEQGSPQVYMPLPVHLAVVMFVTGSVAAAIPAATVAFVIWCLPIFLAGRRVHWVSSLVAVILILANTLWIVNGWSYGLKWQGFAHTLQVTLLNSAVVGALIAIWLINLPWPRFWSCALFYLAVGWWMAWCAFPYLGELP